MVKVVRSRYGDAWYLVVVAEVISRGNVLVFYVGGFIGDSGGGCDDGDSSDSDGGNDLAF